MKTFHFTAILMAAMVALISCGKDEGPGEPLSVKVTSITLSQTTASIVPGTPLQLTVTAVLPADATNQSVTWDSSNSTVATVDHTGLVTILDVAADGATASISATANDGSGKTATCLVTVAYIAISQNAAFIAQGETLQLTATTVQPAGAGGQGVTWGSSNAAAATVDHTGLVTIPDAATDADAATITATTTDGSGKTATCLVTVVPTNGILINGLIWAASNVEIPGRFAGAPEATGLFYQWNRKQYWFATGSILSWDTTTPTGDTWEPANDPCPTGWRLPTKEEQATLLDATKVDIKWITLDSKGFRFTDKTSGTSLFLPAVGHRAYYGDTYYSSALYGVGETGDYWSSSSFSPEDAWYLRTTAGYTDQRHTNRGDGCSVRCIRQ